MTDKYMMTSEMLNELPAEDYYDPREEVINEYYNFVFFCDKILALIEEMYKEEE